MRRAPNKDTERREAANKVRLGLPAEADATIVAFVQGRFIPVDDALLTANLKVQALQARISEAEDKQDGAEEPVLKAARQLAFSLLNDQGSLDNAARQEAFGLPFQEVSRATPTVLVQACQKAIAWLQERPSLPHDANALSTLLASLAPLIAAQGELQAERAALRLARTTQKDTREAWDALYRKLIQTVDLATEGDGWKAYLTGFVDVKTEEIEVVPQT